MKVQILASGEFAAQLPEGLAESLTAQITAHLKAYGFTDVAIHLRPTVTVAIDPKYSMRVESNRLQIVNPAGVPIPPDEPLILFRARDKHALQGMQRYREACALDNCTPYHMEGITNRIDAFVRFRQEQPERMKQPGITQGK